MSDAIVTRPMTDDDVGVVVELLDRALGPAPGGTDRRALFEWKHLANPFGRSIALVAELDRRIVGFRSFMRWELASAGGRISAVRAVDTATDPGVQRRGIFSRLTLEGLDVCRGAGADLGGICTSDCSATPCGSGLAACPGSCSATPCPTARSCRR